MEPVAQSQWLSEQYSTVITYRNRGTACPHTCRIHWRTRGRWDTSQSPQSGRGNTSHGPSFTIQTQPSSRQGMKPDSTATLTCSWTDSTLNTENWSIKKRKKEKERCSPGLAPSNSAGWELYSQRLSLFQRRKRRQRPLRRRTVNSITLVPSGSKLMLRRLILCITLKSNTDSPTSPTMSSFPKNNRKSVTLSTTVTLQD